MTRRLELLGFSYSTTLLVLTLSLTQVSAQDQPPLRCVQGWGSDQVKVIPPHWINDGYCDCPFDGADENNTDACSGIDAWPGSNVAVTADGGAPSEHQVTYVPLIWMDIIAYGCQYSCSLCVVWRLSNTMRSDAALFHFTSHWQPLTE
jgi:hypothetical protein